MEEAIEKLHTKDTKERLAGVERLQILLDRNRKSLSASDVSNLVDASVALLRDNNFKVCQGMLHALTSAAGVSGEHLKLHFNQLVPAVVERLGDSKQSVRDAGRRLLLALMEISSACTIADKAGNHAWGHKNWRVREEFVRTVASAFNLFAATDHLLQRLLLPPVLHALEDSNSNVREAAMLCLEEMYRHGGQHLKEELQGHQLRSAQIKDIAARFNRIEPVRRSISQILSASASSCNIQPNSYQALSKQLTTTNGQGIAIQQANVEPKAATHATGSQGRISPQGSSRPNPVLMLAVDTYFGDEMEVTERYVDPIRVHSERELAKEVEKVANSLRVEQDWSIRMAAMQKLEGLVRGGATEYPCFLTLFKQLVGPLNVQLSDRRSTIVKQACQLLNMLSKDLRADFEIFAELFIPVLFKLVVITVLVIAESSDNCIKMMLWNCRVSRVLPRIIECAKHDRNSVLRARCCEYALLVLERWAESSELQRAADLYEDLIRCCSGDAMGEVRSTARKCYRVFAIVWPDRARRLLSTLDPASQKLVNEEDRGAQKRYTSPFVQDRGCYQQHQLQHSIGIPALPGQTLGGGITHERSRSLISGSGSVNATSLLQRKSMDTPPERNLQKMLQANLHQVNAMEAMLKGLDSDEKGVATQADQTGARDPVGGSYLKIHAPMSAVSVCVSIDPPSARDPPHPASAPALSHGIVLPPMEASDNISGHSIVMCQPATQQECAGSEAGKGGLYEASGPNSTDPHYGYQSGGSQGARRIPLSTERSCKSISIREVGVDKGPKRIPKPEAQAEKLRVGDGSLHSLRGFQRPSLRHPGSGRSSECSSSVADNNLLGGVGDSLSHIDDLMSLNEALIEGLARNADWSARVAAFTYVLKLLQQGSKGLQEVAQNFERVMKLFSGHLDDPHWKVAQAALSALIQLVPACRKLFESYLERTLPSVFARLVDNKDTTRQLGCSALQTIGNTYSIDSLLLPLLRSLDEQRTPKARIAVIDFAISAFAKLASDGYRGGSTGLLKLWLGKLAPLANDKHVKLRETAIRGIVSVYSQFDSTIVLNFILGLPVEEQRSLRRALKQSTPRVDLDLMAHLQNKCQRPRTKCVADSSDVRTTLGAFGEATGRVLSVLSNNSPVIEGYSTFSPVDGGCKRVTAQPDLRVHLHHLGHQPTHPNDQKSHYIPVNLDPAGSSGESSDYSKNNEMCNGVYADPDISGLWLDQSQHKVHPISSANHGSELPSAVSLEKLHEASENAHMSSIDAHLQQLNRELSARQQLSSNIPDLIHQGDTPSLIVPKAATSRQLTKRILLTALKQSSSLSGYQGMSYSSLYSRLPTN